MQGDTYVPFLFVIVLDYALRKTIDGQELELELTLTEKRGRSIYDLDFAVFVLLSNEIEAKDVASQCLRLSAVRLGSG